MTTPSSLARLAFLPLLLSLSVTLQAQESGGGAAAVPPPQGETAPDAAETETAASVGGSGSPDDTGHDFPTVVLADYVLGCMVANGNTYESLQQCSCSIDFIKARMDYKSYEQASTVLQVQLDVGQRGIFYRDSNWAKSRVQRLEELQAESTLRCF